MKRVFLAILPAVVLVTAAQVVSDHGWASLLNSAALVYLAVIVMESILSARNIDGAAASSEQRSDSKSPELTYRDNALAERLTELIGFIGISTPTLVRAANADANPAVLDGWLDVLAARLGAAVRHSCGAMVVRETYTFEDDDLAPYCEVVFQGGAPLCTLPVATRIPVKDGIPAGVAEYSGVRSLYVTSVNPGDARYWVCLGFSVQVTHPLLDSLCDATAGPVAVVISSITRHQSMLSSVSGRDPSTRALFLPGSG